ncbi:MAG: hypothetical protein OEM01_02295 [Desulfobulbaceae bacterium]|nr:hypothetical protein [Desulfobulbaceae bacterium]
MPVSAQDMVERDVDKDMRKPPVSGFKYCLTCRELITAIGAAIDITVQVYATDDCGKEAGGQSAFETVSGHISNQNPGVVSRKQCMGEIIHDRSLKLTETSAV